MLLFGYLMDKKGEKQIIGWGGSLLLGLSALLLIPVNHYTTLLLVLIVVGDLVWQCANRWQYSYCEMVS